MHDKLGTPGEPYVPPGLHDKMHDIGKVIKLSIADFFDKERIREAVYHGLYEVGVITEEYDELGDYQIDILETVTDEVYDVLSELDMVVESEPTEAELFGLDDEPDDTGTDDQ